MITINEHTVLHTLPKWVSRSGTLRASIMGINDGLVSNFCLVMGLAGGTGNNHEIVLITGFIGLLAGSLSMATGEYVSVKAQRDVYEKQVELEKQHLAENPDIEKTKLIESYKNRGLSQNQALTAAEILLSNDRLALETMLKEEHGLSEEQFGSPVGAATGSLLAFMLGALVPIVPYILREHGNPFLLSICLSAIFLTLVGGALSAFSGKTILLGALRMLLAGSVAALATYTAGALINQVM